MKMTMILAAISACLPVSQALAYSDFLSCDFNGAKSALGIRNLRNLSSTPHIPNAWILDPYPATTKQVELLLDKVDFYGVNDNAIQLAMRMHGVNNDRAKFEIALDLKGSFYAQQAPSTWPPFYSGQPRNYFTVTVRKYVGSLVIKGPQGSYGGPVTCEWE